MVDAITKDNFNACFFDPIQNCSPPLIRVGTVQELGFGVDNGDILILIPSDIC